MATRYIYMDDDVCRKEDFPGHVTYRPTEIDFGDYGEANMYVHAYVQYSDTGSLNPVLHIEAMLDGADIVSSAGYYDEMSLRYAVSISYDGHGTSVLNFDDPVNANGHQRIWYANYTVPIKTGRVGEYGNPSRNVDLIGLGMGTGKSMDIPLAYQGCAFSFQIGIYRWNGSGWTSVTSSYEYQSYAPFQTPVTPPNNVYANGVNTFSATIGAAYTSRLKSQISEYSTFDGKFFDRATDQPVRNVNAPYITSGSQTSVIYWNGGIYGSYSSGIFQYNLTVELVIRDPSDSDFLASVSFTTVSGEAVMNSTDDLSAYTTSLSITDLSGYVSQFGAMIRNTDSVIRATANVSVKYGARAQIVIMTFNYGYRTLATVTDTDSAVYDQYVPYNDSNSTRLEIYAESGVIASANFQYPIVDYLPPTIANVSVHRCNTDGTPNDNGDHVRVEWGIVVSPISNLNEWTLRIQLPLETKTYSYDAHDFPYYIYNSEELAEADPASSYEITFQLSDSICNGENAVVRNVSLSTAGVIMDWKYGGHGVSFGKAAEQEYALEVSPGWDLIVYKMLLNDISLPEWVKSIATRMDSIEQFAYNINDGTVQNQVTFYNESDIIKQEWVPYEGTATPPDETPVKEATKAEIFSFIGWTMTYGNLEPDPDALLDVRGYRNIYAQFSSIDRTYLVAFYNAVGETAMRTFNSILYHQSPDYSAYDDLSPTPPTGSSFCGWLPSGRCIEGTVKALAQFYYDQDIEDSWAEIVNACADGTYKEKYKPGNWKMLDLGVQGNIKMRIKGMNMHRMSGQQKAPISWEADNPLATQKAMNNTGSSRTTVQTPEAAFNYLGERNAIEWSAYPYYGDFIFEVNPYANSSSNRAVMSGTFTFPSIEADHLVKFITFNPSDENNAVITVTKDGETVIENYTLPKGYDFIGFGRHMGSGGTLTFGVSLYVEDGTKGIPQVIFEDMGGATPSGQEIYHQATLSYSIGQVNAYTYSDGGAFGGFANSDLHKWLQETVKPLFPDALRMGLKRMRLIQSTLKPKEGYPNFEFVENDWLETDLFIPSTEEIVGNTPGNTEGVDFDVWDLSKRKKGNTSSSSFYWCRDVNPPDVTDVNCVNLYSGIVGNGNSLESIHEDSQTCTSTKPVYICFCT